MHLFEGARVIVLSECPREPGCEPSAQLGDVVGGVLVLWARGGRRERSREREPERLSTYDGR